MISCICDCAAKYGYHLDFTHLHQPFWRRKWQPTPVFLPGGSHGQRSLVGYSPWGRKESDTTERVTHTHICYILDFIYVIVCIYIHTLIFFSL